MSPLGNVAVDSFPAMSKRVRASVPAEPQKKARWTQLALDVGQRDISATKCNTCGMVYSSGLDDIAHRRYHRNALKSAIRFPPSVARSCGSPAVTLQDGSTLFVVDKNSPRGARSIADTAGETAASELGAIALASNEKTHVVLAVYESVVVGYGAFERAGVAMVSAVCSDGSVRGGALIRRSMCGVRLLWVKSGMRLRGLAGALLDVARRSLVYAHVYARSYVSFSPPTPSGARFAVRYAPQRVKRRNRTPVDVAEPSSMTEQNDEENKTDSGNGKEKAGDAEVVLGYILVYKAKVVRNRIDGYVIGKAED